LLLEVRSRDQKKEAPKGVEVGKRRKKDFLITEAGPSVY